jgi:hypothetical protein
MMLPFDSPRWIELRHAYGAAGDIPRLLMQLTDFPRATVDKEPWFSLWSALAHQGDVYSASFAAVPYVVAAIAEDATRASSTYFQFPAWVEICRHQKDVAIPQDLSKPYFDALALLPSLVAAAASRKWDDEFLACALSAIAAAKGFPAVAEASMEIDSKVALEFKDWFSNR